jgi:hypothetical protein
MKSDENFFRAFWTGANTGIGPSHRPAHRPAYRRTSPIALIHTHLTFSLSADQPKEKKAKR